ncbi:hypothetical protein ME1_00612 [Bartonella vinsonii subsp. arupensis OK-94-513]|uniref:Uncharacterized protein n=1 Tax=Bartonella vinsonii subsp. arupensis OK-94-513 TaxID=1094562 RepID=J0QRK7_BARVI|nr:hypothetical protein ME1_00612 [Bartonella vinsonii subsp. arupensis OK-94-513]
MIGGTDFYNETVMVIPLSCEILIERAVNGAFALPDECSEGKARECSRGKQKRHNGRRGNDRLFSWRCRGTCLVLSVVEWENIFFFMKLS